jgi:hypothetical protein
VQNGDGDRRNVRDLDRAQDELTRGRLRRLGEGVGKVVYASEHWVVKRERSPFEVVALILLWKWLRRIERWLPLGLGRRLISRPSLQIRVLRVMTQGILLLVPKSLWWTSHIRQVWRTYYARNLRGEVLAESHLVGTELMPARIEFPPVRVRVGGWPGWLTVSEAEERVEATLDQRLKDLARADKFNELEEWLLRFLSLRPEGWRRGIFSMDAHLKNFGVIGERIVLLDAGGLTNRWQDVERRLEYEEVVSQPHIQLGLGLVLGARPDIASRFDRRWKALVNRQVVGQHWPDY